MKKSKLVLALAAASMLPGVAFSAAPVGTTFGAGNDWSLTGTVVDHTCPTGYTCDSAPIVDANFLQVQMTNNTSGAIYYRTIIAASGTGEVFDNESFVASGTGSATGGIAARQTLNAASANSGTMTSTTALNIGTFLATGDNQVDLTQDIWDNVAAGPAPEFHSGFGFTKDNAGTTGETTLDQQIAVVDEFSDRFNYVQSKNLTNDTVIGTTLDIVSGVRINNLPTGTPPGTGSVQDQGFAYSLREGTAYVGTAGSAALGTGTGAGTTTWNAGEKVSHVLVGQNVDLAGSFGYERVSNETTAQSFNEFSLASQGPFATWTNDPFSTVVDPQNTTVSAAPAVP